MATASQQKKSEKLRLFSERLQAALAKWNFQDNEIARKVGVEPSAISNWRQGRNMAKGKNLRRLAEVLQCQPAWLSGDASGIAAGPSGKSRLSAGKDHWQQRALHAEKKLADLRSGLSYLLQASGDLPPSSETLPAIPLPETSGTEILPKPGGSDNLRA